MIGRRSLITAALGALGASASGVKASDVVRAAAGLGSGTMDGPNPFEGPCVTVGGVDISGWWSATEPLRNAISDEEEQLERAMYNGLPADIAAKRSWSGVVKQSKAQERLRKLRATRRALEQEDSALSILRELGIKL